MGIETAFLLGVIVGQWLMLYALWRASTRLIQVLASLRNNDPTTNPGKVIIIPPVEGMEED